jgi:hypothetical protein
MYADDSGRLPGGSTFATLPATKAAFMAQATKAGADPDDTGYLAYAIADGYQQLVKDFAFWRADLAGERLATDAAKRAWLTADRQRRERQIVQDIGVWAHYVGAASQPMHLSIHHDGWGPYPNPRGFTQDKVHVPWEGAYVARNLTPEAVRAELPPPYHPQGALLERIASYLAEGRAALNTFYVLEQKGAFRPAGVGASPAWISQGRTYTTQRVALGAGRLRDLITAAWEESAAAAVNNYPPVPVVDIETGRADAYDVLHGVN